MSYDQSPTTYSPDGKVYQLEYAQKAVDNGGTTVGIRCSDGVVLGVEKTVTSKLMVEGNVKRVFAVDTHAGIATTGMSADGRMVANRCRGECRQYKRFLGEQIPGGVLCDRIASYFHLFTLYWFMRPMGAAALMAVVDQDGPQLYGLETSGQAFRYHGTAIGKGRQSAKTEMERLKLEQLTCREGVKQVAKMLHNAHEEKEKDVELELGWICSESGYNFCKVPESLRAEADKEARDAIEAQEMGQ